jgi:hypothetical protein
MNNKHKNTHMSKHQARILKTHNPRNTTHLLKSRRKKKKKNLEWLQAIKNHKAPKNTPTSNKKACCVGPPNGHLHTPLSKRGKKRKKKKTSSTNQHTLHTVVITIKSPTPKRNNSH